MTPRPRIARRPPSRPAALRPAGAPPNPQPVAAGAPSIAPAPISAPFAAAAGASACPSPRGRLTGADRRTQILAAALEVFSEQGFHGTRTRELAERAGVSEALVFHHFPTKEALIRAIIDLVGFEEHVHQLEERFRDMPPREALVSLAAHVLGRLRDQPHFFRVVFFGILETPELAREFYGRFLSRLLALETQLFERAFAERRLAPGATSLDPAVAARSFHGSLLFYNFAGAIVRIEPLPQDPQALAAALVNVYLPEASS